MCNQLNKIKKTTRMKKIIYLAIFTIIFSIPLFAQKHGANNADTAKALPFKNSFYVQDYLRR